MVEAVSEVCRFKRRMALVLLAGVKPRSMSVSPASVSSGYALISHVPLVPRAMCRSMFLGPTQPCTVAAWLAQFLSQVKL